MKTVNLSLAVMLGLASASAANAGSASSDQAFVTKAAQGGMAEVALGKTASARGSSAEVKSFGSKMASDHAKANDALKSAAGESGAMVPGEPSKSQQTMARKFEAMQGPAFDKAYAAAMVKDHKETVALFEKESASGKNEKLKAFAAETLPTLKDHLKMAQELQAGMK